MVCDQHPLLPVGLSDVSGVKPVKLYCAKCEDIYNPKSSRHACIDGAYFGTSFHGILFQVHPGLVPEKTQARYEPRIFGFRVHANAALARWQDKQRDDMKSQLSQLGMESSFVEDREQEEEESDDVDDVGDLEAASLDRSSRMTADLQSPMGNGRMDVL